MKKMTKKSLDELAKIMPVISEKAQSEICGAVKFYNQSGIYLGQIGGSDELRFVDNDVTFDGILRQVTNSMARGPTETFKERQEDATLKTGSSWSATTDVARRAMVASVINNESELSSLRGLRQLESWNSGSRAAIVATDAETGEIYLGISAKEDFFCSYNEVVATLIHEVHHVSGGVSGNASSDEDAAYRYQVSSSFYKDSNDKYKLDVARGAYYSSQWRPDLAGVERRNTAALLFGVDANKI